MFRRQCFLQLKRIAARCEAEIPRRSGKCLNSVQLIGYSGSDPLKGSADNQPTKFSLATTQYYQSREEDRLESKTQWHNVAVFKPWLQDTVNSYVRKGMCKVLQKCRDSLKYHRSSIKEEQTVAKAKSLLVRTRLFIQGHIDYSNYVDQEGIKRFSTSIIPDSVIILSQPVSMEEETGY